MQTIADASRATGERKTAWSDFHRDVKDQAAAEEETFYAEPISKTWGQDAVRQTAPEHQQLTA